MHNIKLIIAYDGRDYMGWQKTETGPSIEAAMQKVLEQVLQHPIVLQAASRTDRGVHARGQVLNFLTSKHDLDLHKLQISLNGLLPDDIAVLSVENAPTSFHPTLDNKGKSYFYYLCTQVYQLPEHRLYSWHTPGELDVEAMRKAADHLTGSHSFTAFCNTKKNAHYSHHVRTIESIAIDELDEKRLCVKVRGNHFLYKMVRNIVGTLVYVGRGKIELDKIVDLIASEDRAEAGMTAPAHGLFLQEVYYT